MAAHWLSLPASATSTSRADGIVARAGPWRLLPRGRLRRPADGRRRRVAWCAAPRLSDALGDDRRLPPPSIGPPMTRQASGVADTLMPGKNSLSLPPSGDLLVEHYELEIDQLAGQRADWQHQGAIAGLPIDRHLATINAKPARQPHLADDVLLLDGCRLTGAPQGDRVERRDLGCLVLQGLVLARWRALGGRLSVVGPTCCAGGVKQRSLADGSGPDALPDRATVLLVAVIGRRRAPLVPGVEVQPGSFRGHRVLHPGIAVGAGVQEPERRAGRAQSR
jgi:hypothetical protein